MQEDPQLRAALDDFSREVEVAAQQRGTKTREGLAYDPSTGQLSDAMSWELENEPD